MADFNVSQSNGYHVPSGLGAAADPYNKGDARVAESAFTMNQDAANHFVGDHQSQAAYPSGDGYQALYQNAAAAQYASYQTPTDAAYASAANGQNYTLNAEYYANYSGSNANAKYLQPKPELEPRQVNSSHHHSESDQGLSTEASQEYNNSHSANAETGSAAHDTSKVEGEREKRDRSSDTLRSNQEKRKRSRSRSHRRERRHKSRSRSRRRSKERRRKRSKSPRRSHKRSRSRERHRSRRSHSSDRHERRSRDRDRRDKDRRRDPSREKSREGEGRERDVGREVLEKAHMLRSSEIEKRRLRDIEEAQRDDLTVLVANMNLSVDERDIYELFSEHAGKVRDIQCVRDQRSGRSKGIAYVEFYTQEAVIKALSMTGMSLRGQSIRVQSSQAEKNRAARAAKQLQDSALKESDNPTTIMVSNLVGVLGHLGETDLQQLFAPFGNVTEVAVARNDLGHSKGYAYIRFKRWTEAKEALNVMNGFDISGQQIKVAYVTTNKGGKSRLQSLGDLDIERLDDEEAGLISGSGNKIALMKKLQQRQPTNSSNIVLSNMYSSEDADQPEFFEEIEEDVREECSKYGEVVKVYLNKRKPDGKVYVKFRTLADAQSAHKSLQGRYFAGNTIQVAFLSDDQFLALTSK